MRNDGNEYLNIIKEELLNHSLDDRDIKNIIKIEEEDKILLLNNFMNDTSRKDLIEKFLVKTLQVPLEEICIIYKKQGICNSEKNNWVRFTAGYNTQFNEDIYEIISYESSILQLPYNKYKKWRTIYTEEIFEKNKEKIREYISSLTLRMLINYVYVILVDEDGIFVFNGDEESYFKHERLKISDKPYLINTENIRRKIEAFDSYYLVENQEKLYCYCNTEDYIYSLKFINMSKEIYLTKFPFLLLRLSVNRSMRYFLYSTLKDEIVEMYYPYEIWTKKSMTLLVRQYLYNDSDDILLEASNNIEELAFNKEAILIYDRIKKYAENYLKNKVKDRTIKIIVANFDTLVFESKNSIAWLPNKPYTETIKKRLNINTDYIITIEELDYFLNDDKTINYSSLEKVMNHEFVHILEEETEDFKEVINSNGIEQYVTHGEIFNELEELIINETDLPMSSYIDIATKLILER